MNDVICKPQLSDEAGADFHEKYIFGISNCRMSMIRRAFDRSMLGLYSQFFSDSFEHFYIFQHSLKFEELRSTELFIENRKTPNMIFCSDGSMKS